MCDDGDDSDMFVLDCRIDKGDSFSKENYTWTYLDKKLNTHTASFREYNHHLYLCLIYDPKKDGVSDAAIAACIERKARRLETVLEVSFHGYVFKVETVGLRFYVLNKNPNAYFLNKHQSTHYSYGVLVRVSALRKIYLIPD